MDIENGIMNDFSDCELFQKIMTQEYIPIAEQIAAVRRKIKLRHCYHKRNAVGDDIFFRPLKDKSNQYGAVFTFVEYNVKDNLFTTYSHYILYQELDEITELDEKSCEDFARIEKILADAANTTRLLSNRILTQIKSNK